MKTYSITHIKKKSGRKTNPELVATILAARKSRNWLPIAHKISGPTRKLISINLDQIDKQTSTGDTVVIPGKVLSLGNLSKKVRISALGISASALEKLKLVKAEYVSILEEISKNPKAEGIKVLS